MWTYGYKVLLQFPQECTLLFALYDLQNHVPKKCPQKSWFLVPGREVRKECFRNLFESLTSLTLSRQNEDPFGTFNWYILLIFAEEDVLRSSRGLHLTQAWCCPNSLPYIEAFCTSWRCTLAEATTSRTYNSKSFRSYLIVYNLLSHVYSKSMTSAGSGWRCVRLLTGWWRKVVTNCPLSHKLLQEYKSFLIHILWIATCTKRSLSTK